MKVYFWGTRGSLPASYSAETIRQKIDKAIRASCDLTGQTENIQNSSGLSRLSGLSLPFAVSGSYGSNTSCVEIDQGDEYVLCDAGTGLRDFGNFVLKTARSGRNKSNIFHIFLSHLHWDHIQGFPFFTPAYIPGNRVCLYGFHKELEQAFVRQQEYPFFPIPLKAMQANIEFRVLEEGREYDIAGYKVLGIQQNHPGISYGYRFVKDDKIIVYSTDSEHKENAGNDEYSFLQFFKDADLLVFDAQYSLLDATSSKEDWGHSNNVIAVELSVKADVRRLCIFHNEPTSNDERLDEILDETRRYLKFFAPSSLLLINMAYDGLQVDL
ncbi:MAG TPA: MBL fold metallo-hydrolase [Smithellaceae bacterium]|nr:MBL fold metallo-hydrolase [Smithellaceae bacterium]